MRIATFPKLGNELIALVIADQLAEFSEFLPRDDPADIFI